MKEYTDIQEHYDDEMNCSQEDDCSEDDCSEVNQGFTYDLWTGESIEIETPFSGSLDDIDCLRLEVTELRQIIIRLAEKYKLSEDRRKVAERRNAFLKNDNRRLQELSEVCLKQKCDAKLDLDITLNKMREFISYKNEFEKKAQLLQNIINNLPKKKNAWTNTESPQSETKFVETIEEDTENEDNEFPNDDPLDDCHQILDIENNERCTTISDSEKLSEEEEKFERYNEVKAVCNWTLNRTKEKFEEYIDNDKEVFLEPKNSVDQFKEVQNEELEGSKERSRRKERIDYKSKICVEATGDSNREVTSTRVLTKLNKLKQEVTALKNLNDWKTNDLEFKKQELAVKIHQLEQAKKEIHSLKNVVKKLQSNRVK